jgi:hypothetical protein
MSATIGLERIDMRWLVSATFDFLLQFAMLSWLVAGAVLGYNAASSSGSGGTGALVGFLLALVTGSLITGTIFVVLEIAENIKVIRKKVEVLEDSPKAATQDQTVSSLLREIASSLRSIESLLDQLKRTP